MQLWETKIVSDGRHLVASRLGLTYQSRRCYHRRHGGGGTRRYLRKGNGCLSVFSMINKLGVEANCRNKVHWMGRTEKRPPTDQDSESEESCQHTGLELAQP